jgi:hypothetical protein
MSVDREQNLGNGGDEAAASNDPLHTEEEKRVFLRYGISPDLLEESVRAIAEERVQPAEGEHIILLDVRL